jgi:hypothetical protein
MTRVYVVVTIRPDQQFPGSLAAREHDPSDDTQNAKAKAEQHSVPGDSSLTDSFLR